jgi:RNA polymerase sigma-70 factor (ECF subfamily)
MSSVSQFEALVNDYYELLYRFALSLARSESDARDLTQQTFYIWATKGSQLRDISKAKTWLFTTLHRTFLGMKRKNARYPQVELEEALLPAVSAEFTGGSDCAQILAALAKVDERYRAAVVLFYLQEHPYKEIALILEVPVGTVKSRIARGVEQLRNVLLSDKTFENICLN